MIGPGFGILYLTMMEEPSTTVLVRSSEAANAVVVRVQTAIGKSLVLEVPRYCEYFIICDVSWIALLMIMD